jgi:hypothetical protein
MPFASPFPDVDIPDVSVYDLLFADIDPADLDRIALSMSQVRQRLPIAR